MQDASNWGRWGSDDERGAKNLLTDAAVLRACAAPSKGRVYDLGIELRRGAPFAGNRMSPVHLMSSDGGDYAALGRDDWGTSDDYLILASGGTTHVDGLAHVWSGGFMYNGHSYREVRSSGAAKCGIEKAGGLVSRGVLLDFSSREIADDQISSADIDSWFREHGLEAQAGDALLFRTGWMDDALAGRPDERSYPVVGLDAANWIAEHDIAVVAADNPAVETTGQRGTLPPLHSILIRDLGLYLLEMLTLRAPAEDGVLQGMFIVAPLLITRGVNSPVNPLLVA
jgi:kynurenine formamidase